MKLRSKILKEFWSTILLEISFILYLKNRIKFFGILNRKF